MVIEQFANWKITIVQLYVNQRTEFHSCAELNVPIKNGDMLHSSVAVYQRVVVPKII